MDAPRIEKVVAIKRRVTELLNEAPERVVRTVLNDIQDEELLCSLTDRNNLKTFNRVQNRHKLLNV